MAAPVRADDAAITKGMLGEARAEIVWVRAEAPDDFWADPEVVRCVWLVADAAAELRGRLAKHNQRHPALYDQEQQR